MNNLSLVIIAGTLGIAVYWQAQAPIDEATLAANRASAELAAVAIRRTNSRAEMRRLEKTFVTEKENIQKLRAQFNLLSAQRAATVDENQFTPEKEGFWPAEKPYFYISKVRLGGLSYWPFTDDENRISKYAALLFGLSAEEDSAASAAYLQMREAIRQLEMAGAVRTNTPPEIEHLPGTKTSLFMPGIPRETINELDHRFKAALTDAIGPERAAILGRRIDETFAMSVNGLIHARTLTLIRDGDKIQLAECDRAGNTTRSSTTDDDGKQIIPRHARHLFRD
jgi:hypothetical protein